MARRQKPPRLSKEEVKHVASLAKLSLTEKEIAKFQKQLSEILDYIGRLQELNTEKTSPTSQTTGLENVFRKDKIDKKNLISSQEALSGASQVYKAYFKVKGVFEKS